MENRGIKIEKSLNKEDNLPKFKIISEEDLEDDEIIDILKKCRNYLSPLEILFAIENSDYMKEINLYYLEYRDRIFKYKHIVDEVTFDGIIQYFIKNEDYDLIKYVNEIKKEYKLKGII